MRHSVRQVKGHLQTKRMPLFSRKSCKIKVKLRQRFGAITSITSLNLSSIILQLNFICYFPIALEEARDINIHLKPLRRLLDDMEQFDFSELEKIIPAILHTVGLIWANSKYYCRAPRMIVLLQELCNMLIEMVSSQ